MERVLGHVDVEEMYLDVDPENLPDKGEIVETAHFFVGQAYNAHIHVVEKESGDMVIQRSCWKLSENSATSVSRWCLRTKTSTHSSRQAKSS